MPRDGSGNYTLPTGNPVITDTVIASSWANDTMTDIAVQLNNVVTRDGSLGPVGTFRLADGSPTNPGLAFTSEPGLGWYRPGASLIGIVAVGKQIWGINGATANSTLVAIQPRTTGSSQILLID